MDDRGLVIDANILFDFEAGDGLHLLHFLHPLPILPPLVSEEISDLSEERIAVKALFKPELSEELLEIPPAWFDLQSARALSVADLQAVAIAKNTDSVLLTGERAATKFAASEGVESHGTIWVLNQIAQSNSALHPEVVLCAETLLLKPRRRLPELELKRLIQRLS
jgi:predicted nucleic acid-binding protein